VHSPGRSPLRDAPLLLVCLIGTGFARAQPDDPHTLLQQATALYASHQYERAAERYAEVLRQRPDSPDVLLCLGNASLKAGHLGEAILAYERAVRLRPRDRAIRNDLRLATLARADQFVVPAPSRLHAPLARMRASVTLNEALMAAVVGYWGLCFALAARFATTAPRARRALAVAALCLAICLCAAGAMAGSKVWVAHRAPEGIVLVPETAARSGPGEGFGVLFTVHEGTEFRLGARQGVWQEVTIPTDASGWVRRDAFEAV
jgi:tetratricopeptide (TPR) repeat protein